MFITFNGNLSTETQVFSIFCCYKCYKLGGCKKQDNSEKIIFRIVLCKLLISMSGSGLQITV